MLSPIIGLFANMLLQWTSQVGQPLTCSYLESNLDNSNLQGKYKTARVSRRFELPGVDCNSHVAGASVRSGRELSDELTEPHGASSSLTICKSWNGGHCVVPSSSCCFAPKCSSCFGPHCVGACPVVPPSQSHPSSKGQSSYGLDQTCSLLRVHPTFSLDCFRLED